MKRENLQDLKLMLVAMKNLGESITKELPLAFVEYSGVREQLEVQVGQSDFEVGGAFPVHRVTRRDSVAYPWKAECYLGDDAPHGIVVSALCNESDVFRLAIDEDTKISPEALRYINFLKAEKDLEAKEVSASGVAGN